MADHQKLHTFVDWMLEQSDAIFIKKIPILREWLCQKKNSQTSRKITQSQKCIVWCALRAEGIIGPYFVEEETVSGLRYRKMLNDFFFQ